MMAYRPHSLRSRAADIDRCHQLIQLPVFVDHLKQTSGEIYAQNSGLWSSRVDRFILKNLSRFCRVDLLSYYNQSVEKTTTNNHQVDRHASDSQQQPLKYRRDASRGNCLKRWASYWPALALAYYIYAAAKMCLNVYYQYVHDYHLFKLKHIAKLRSNPAGLQNNQEVSSEYLAAWEGTQVEAMREAKANLVWLGAPFYRSSYFIEIAYQFIVDLSFAIYIDGQIYFNLVMDLNFRLARVLLRPQCEELHDMQLVCQEVNKYINSSRNFTSAHLACFGLGRANHHQPVSPARTTIYEENNNCHHQTNQEVADQEEDSCSSVRTSIALAQQHLLLDGVTSMDELLADQESCVSQLKRLCLNDSLRPLNCNAHCVQWLSLWFCLISTSCLFWGFSILAVTALAWRLYLDVDLEAFGAIDALMAADNIILVIYLILGVTFYVSIVFIGCLDQISYLDKLRSLIRQRTQQNRFKYFTMVHWSAHESQNNAAHAHCSAPRRQSAREWPNECHNLRQKNSLLRNELHLRTMNCNLLYCFIHYKIYTTQAKSQRRSCNLIALHSVIIWFVLPIMARLHQPYVVEDAKWVQLYICLATCVFIDCILVPICSLHDRSISLYKDLCSLLAQTIETQTIHDHQHHHYTALPESLLLSSSSSFNWTSSSSSSSSTTTSRETSKHRSLYNSHLVGLLRKELNYPEMFMRQFENVALGLHVTYPNLVKIHFWFGIILLSLISGVATREDSLLGGFLSDPFNLL